MGDPEYAGRDMAIVRLAARDIGHDLPFFLSALVAIGIGCVFVFSERAFNPPSAWAVMDRICSIPSLWGGIYIAIGVLHVTAYVAVSKLRFATYFGVIAAHAWLVVCGIIANGVSTGTAAYIGYLACAVWAVFNARRH